MLWGCKNLINHFSEFTIDSVNKKMSHRFTAPGNVTLNTFNVYVVRTVGSPPKMNFTLYGDSAGLPYSILLNSSVNAGSGFNATNALNYTLESGKVYHCVVRGASGHNGSNYHVIRILNRTQEDEV